MMDSTIDYTVRVSRRARRARIVVRPNMSVEVVLPHGLPHHHAASFVREKRGWIERSLKRFGDLPQSEMREGAHHFPQQLLLDGVGLNLSISYLKTDSDHVRVIETPAGLKLRGSVDDQEKVKSALQRWLKKKARELLPEMLDELAKLHGYPYRKVTIRLQKSRWGSCSKAGNINLNAKLLFLPPQLLRYVILHELGHLKHLNHSPSFWKEVAMADPDYRSHIREMRVVSYCVPDWAEN